MICQDEVILERFRFYESMYRHPPRGRATPPEWSRINIDLYQMAQVIGSRYAQSIQAELDDTRKAVVAALAAAQGSVTLSPAKLRRPVRWCEYILTPELEGNLALTGARVPRDLAVRLREAHRAQIKAVRAAVGI